jgi:hypothetical protein
MPIYEARFRFTTDEPLHYPQTAVEDALDCEFDNMEVIEVKTIKEN